MAITPVSSATAKAPLSKPSLWLIPVLLLLMFAGGLVWDLWQVKEQLRITLAGIRAKTSQEDDAQLSKEQALRARLALRLTMAQGYETAWKLLPEELARLAVLTGSHHEVREIAIKALEAKVSTDLVIDSKTPPVFSPDGRWIIHLTSTGDIKFTEAWFLHAPGYLLPANATDLALSGNNLFYKMENEWSVRKMDMAAGGRLTLGPALPHAGAAPSPSDQEWAFMLNPQLGSDGSVAVEFPAGVRTRILSNLPVRNIVLSPDHRQLLVQHESLPNCRLWCLNRLREELSAIQLDWALPPFPATADSASDWGKIEGETGFGISRLEPSSPGEWDRDTPRRRVVLPSP
jgi:hypothetical protein